MRTEVDESRNRSRIVKMMKCEFMDIDQLPI